MDVRTVNSHVAARATLIVRIHHAVCRGVWHRDATVIARTEVARARMALDAQGRDGRSHQQLGVG